MKILHLAQCAGGVDVYLRMLFKYLDNNCYENILVCSQDFRAHDYKGLAEVVQIDMENRISLSKDLKAVGRVRKVLKEYKPDILYCHSSKAGGIGRIAALGLNIPTVYNPHGWAINMLGTSRKMFFFRMIEKALSKVTNHFVAISDYEKQVAIVNHIAKEDNITTIFNGIDLDAVSQQVKQNNTTIEALGIPEDAWVVGMVGRIAAQKSPDTFVKMAAKVKSAIPNAWFMIFGDGILREEIEQMVSQYNLMSCFIITGWTNTPCAYANLFDQAILLSRWEGFGLALAEYMALGKPIVATNVDAIPDLIKNNENGILVEKDDAEAAANAVIKLYNDSDLRNAMIEKGIERVNACYDVRRTAKEHEDLFVKICKTGGVNCKGYYCNYAVFQPRKVWEVAA